MAQNNSSEALRRPLSVFRVSFLLVALAAMILGYLGLRQFLDGNPDYDHRPADLLYYDLQLFFFNSDPLQGGGHFPPLLKVARLMAPAVPLFAVLEAVRVLFAAELSRLRARRSRGGTPSSGATRRSPTRCPAGCRTPAPRWSTSGRRPTTS